MLLFDEITNKNGFTIDNNLKKVQDEGFFVSVPDMELSLPFSLLNSQLVASIIKAYQKNNNHFIGCWVNEDRVYFDSSIILFDKETALNVALDFNQSAIFDNVKKETIFLVNELSTS